MSGRPSTAITAPGAPPIPDAVVIVRDGRIVSAGPHASTTIPRGLPIVGAKGQTLLPGLWEMHTHASDEAHQWCMTVMGHVPQALSTTRGRHRDVRARHSHGTGRARREGPGTVEAGKRADLILVGGDPLSDIPTRRKVTRVVTDGRMYDTVALWKGVGFRR